MNSFDKLINYFNSFNWLIRDSNRFNSEILEDGSVSFEGISKEISGHYKVNSKEVNLLRSQTIIKMSAIKIRNEAKMNVITSNYGETKNRHQNKRKNDSSKEALAKVFKLNIDCFDEVFGYLSMRDLVCLGQTCSRMQKIVRNYFEENLSAFDLHAKHNGLYLDCCKNGCKVAGVEPFIQKLSIRTNGIIDFVNASKIFRYIGANANKSLQKLQISFVQLTGREIECIKDTLGNVKTVVIEQCRMNGKFYAEFPMICRNLRHLYVEKFQCNRNVVKRSGNEWLLRQWPKLLHLGWTQTDDGQKVDEFKRFFELNPNVRSFSTDLSTLWTNRDAILQSNVRLDELTVEIFSWGLPNGDFAHNFLNELYDIGVYRRLHLHATFCEPHHLEQMVLVKGLEALRYPNLTDGMLLSKCIHLKELRIGMISPLPNIDILAKSLVNLKRLHIRYAATDDFLPFIYHSPKLKSVKIDIVGNRNDFNSLLDLVAMENERKKLKWARKVRIYIDECVYLATKWVYGTTNFRFIEVKRAHSREWSNHFEYY